MITVVITKNHMQYPGYDTYTAYEFLQVNAERLRNVEMVLIAERMNTKKLRKIRNRMNAFNIVEIDMLPDDVIDVAEANSVYLPHSGIHVNVKDVSNPEEVRKTLLKHLREMSDKILKETGFDPNKLRPAGQPLLWIDTINPPGISPMLKLRDSAEELKRELLVKRPSMYRSKSVPPGVIVHKHGFTAGKEHRVKVKPWLENPQIVQLFKSRQELADYLVAKLPKDTELRKRNALKFKICVELSEDKVLTLAADPKAQVALVNKYC